MRQDGLISKAEVIDQFVFFKYFPENDDVLNPSAAATLDTFIP